ncbi:MAG: bifunctional phosphoribosyl-AMP cyclohydrolase/phosphoribosyl-ATP diphosphatase HisIE [Candidatus Methanomethylicia archaeon]|nr:bifunctional phosphoribosyl-AMP cyclohydrolase/phosphoribosyl-ATP diphosphatase HisIE [Candidatus Methanomethylicia archaeon]
MSLNGKGKTFSEAEAGKIIKDLDFAKMGGIIPAIAVGADGEVLMLAFMNAEALERTLRTGMVHYWSRTRKRVWMKGEESGHYQYLLGVYSDCDRDSLLLKVKQVGPACHTNNPTCFYNAIEPYAPGGGAIRELEQVIDDRMRAPREGSYTSKVISAGINEAAKKVGEEGIEVAVASLAESRERVVSEAADLIYHLMLLLRMKGLHFSDVEDELRRRRKR